MGTRDPKDVPEVVDPAQPQEQPQVTEVVEQPEDGEQDAEQDGVQRENGSAVDSEVRADGSTAYFNETADAVLDREVGS